MAASAAIRVGIDQPWAKGGKGPFSGWLTAVEKQQKIALTRALQSTAEGIKREVRDHINAAFNSQEAGFVFKSELYPNRRGVYSFRAAVEIYPRSKKARALIDSWERGPTVRSPNGFFLAIPTEQVRSLPGFRGRDVTPRSFQQVTGIPLDFVYQRPPKKSFLVASVVSARDGRGYRPLTKKRADQGRVARSEIMFILIPMARHRKRTNITAIIRKWAARVPVEILNQLKPLEPT